MTEWPLLNVAPDMFDVLPDASRDAASRTAAIVEGLEEVSAVWGDELSIDIDGTGPPANQETEVAGGGGGWNDELDIDIPDDLLAAAKSAAKGPIFVAPRSIPGREQK